MPLDVITHRKEIPEGREPNGLISETQEEIFFTGPSLARWNIFPKGRRLGATRGAAIAFTIWMTYGNACLWGDTVNSNIDRYIERYFIPFIKKCRLKYKWDSVKRILRVGKGYTDFRSADRPENWEGFGYDKIFLNEAGIILDREYLYHNAVLPMMMDNPNSILIASGTPKLSRGKGKLFKELWLKVQEKQPNYYGKQFNTYDNPYLDEKSIEELEKQIAPQERPQEIWGDFIDSSGVRIPIGWFRRYGKLPGKPLRIIQSWDTASKANEINDPSVCTTWYEYLHGFYLVDIYRRWVEYPELKKAALSLAAQYKPNKILIEDKSSGQSLIQDLHRATSLNIQGINPVQDKVTRMLIESTAIHDGNVFIPESAPWLYEFEKEITDFPINDTDDQLDSMSQFLRWTREGEIILIG